MFHHALLHYGFHLQDCSLKPLLVLQADDSHCLQLGAHGGH